MGDRANVQVKQTWREREYTRDKTGSVFLYTHWAGTELPETVRKALARKLRWDDMQYLPRILFDEITKGDQGEETGFGISCFIGDGRSRVMVVDIDKQTVTMEACSGAAEDEDRDLKKTWTFDEYIKLKNVGWDIKHHGVVDDD